MTNPFLAAAHTYIGMGWHVFPLRPNSKVPLFPSAHPDGDPLHGTCKGECGQLGHGCHDATNDPDVADQWWTRFPRANIGIATGAPGPDVLDVDVKDGRPGAATLERLRQAGLLAGPIALVRTPSGGTHLYFLGSTQGNHTLARHGLDFRGRGGYVAAVPSTVDGNSYELLERRDPAAGRQVSWAGIREMLDPPRPARRRAAHRPGINGLPALAKWVAAQPEGNRNAGLYWAAHRAVADGHTDLDALVTAAIVAGLPEHEARATVASALRGAHSG